MFQANITNKEVLEDGRLKVSLNFSNGSQNFSEVAIVQDGLSLDNFINMKLKSLAFTTSDAVSTGIFTPKVEPVILPTIEDIARDDWLLKLSKYNRIKARLGDVADTEISILLSELKKDYLPEYLDFI